MFSSTKRKRAFRPRPSPRTGETNAPRPIGAMQHLDVDDGQRKLRPQ